MSFRIKDLFNALLGYEFYRRAALARVVISGAVLLLFLGVSSASAELIPSDETSGIIVEDVIGDFWGTDGESEWHMTPILDVDEIGDFHLFPEDQDVGTFSVSSVELWGNIDPVISAGFTVTNNTLAVQDYSFIFTLPVTPLGPTTLTGGSTTLGITDTNGDTATAGVHSNGRPYYMSQIDGSDWTPIALTPFGPTGAFGSLGTAGSFGAPIPSLPGPAVAATIGIRYDFSLTPGDRAAVTGVFVVAQGIGIVPEPGTLLLGGLGLLGLLSMRRRL